MAVLDARPSGAPASMVSLSAAQTGTGPSTNVADRGVAHKAWAVCRIITTIGATPTCTYALEVSADGSTWTAATYADVSTPTTDVSTTFVVTTATTVQKIIKPGGWRFFRVNYSANTNVTNTADLLFSEARRLP